MPQDQWLVNMTRKQPWLRLYSEIIWDRKIRCLSPDHRWLWITALALARSSPKPGHLLLTETEPLTIKDITDAAALHPKTVSKGISKLFEIGLLEGSEDFGFCIPRWDERQFESDSSADRVAKHRRSKGSSNPTANHVTDHGRYIGVTETVLKRQSNGPDTETDTETEKNEKHLVEENPTSTRLLEKLNNALKLNGVKPATGKTAIKQMQLLVERDQRPPDEIERVISFATADSFWMLNIHSPSSLRKHYDRLRLQMERPSSNGHVAWQNPSPEKYLEDF
jgi:hypothetical protein